MREVTLVGGGLSGALLALMLARKGVKVTVYERRADTRVERVEEGRSINLALSVRGIHALQLVGLDAEVLARTIPMRGRYIHPVSGACSLIPYGHKPDEVIHSVGRRGLNAILLDAVAREPNATVHFQHRCTGYNLRARTLSLRDEAAGREFTAPAPVVIGTDGAASAVRLALTQSTRMNYSQEYLEHGYKELTIPPATDGSFRIDPNALHIWPRGGFMMIALPNLDRSFTCTLFLPHHGPSDEFRRDRGAPGVWSESYRSHGPNTRRPDHGETAHGFDHFTTTPREVLVFFAHTFPDAVPLLTDLESEFFHNPTGDLVTVRCGPWHVGGQALLLGDAAHAIVPFFGQGMNCAFEDCAVLLELFDRHSGNWDKIFPEFYAARKPNTDAIARLALDNFVEMRDTSADPRFALKRQLEHLLEDRYPGRFVSKYAMVSFHRFPYAEALERGRAQDAILMDACANARALSEIDADAVFAQLQTARS